MNPIPPRDEQKKQVLAFVRARAPKPTLIGQVALLFGWWAPLDRIEMLLEEMVYDGQLRVATKVECRQWDIMYGYLPV